MENLSKGILLSEGSTSRIKEHKNFSMQLALIGIRIFQSFDLVSCLLSAVALPVCHNRQLHVVRLCVCVRACVQLTKQMSFNAICLNGLGLCGCLFWIYARPHSSRAQLTVTNLLHNLAACFIYRTVCAAA